ncbi:probable xyloglucan galactosyltransferase GT19 [Aristolochia californica]|uniref:probable xyloglucan galactosyltransferase GT19 n=1 Tax=Aristolochia californica TaxID=171875 RepID=UPI0035E302ED
MASFFPFSFLLVISLSLLLFPNFAVAEDGSENPGCDGRWIHVRRLPSRFNLDLLRNCSEYPIYDDFCPYIANHGLGQKTHNRSRSWYRTDSHMLELFFHRRVLEYPCLTPDPDRADAVFLPYYAGLDALSYLYGPDVNSSADHGLQLFDFLQSDSPQIWDRRSGYDHFLVMARPAWDFSQPLEYDPPIWGTSFLQLPEFFNVTALILESRPWPWQEQAIPYPTSFHPANLARFEQWLARVRRSRRTTLMLFAGGGGTASAPNVRHSIRNECENRTSLCDIVECSNAVCEHDPIRYMRPMLRASFCLQPPGDTPTRRSTFDSILAGCIPVFFEELSARKQYGWHLPAAEYSDFSVYIPKEEVVSNGLKIADVLLGIPRAKVRRMRERLLELMPHIIYRRHRSSAGLMAKKDAFDLAVDGVLERVKRRLAGGNELIR